MSHPDVPEWISRGPNSKEAKAELAKSRALRRKLASPYSPGPGKSLRVYQDEFGVSAQPIWLFTTGLGPCIGICIAWQRWAGIAHSSWIEIDEFNLIAPLISRAKKVIPAKKLLSVRPVVCGGDISDDDGISGPEEDSIAGILESRKRIIEILGEAGFGPPLIRWNKWGETTRLIVHRNRNSVYIENEYAIVAEWRIGK